MAIYRCGVFSRSSNDNCSKPMTEEKTKDKMLPPQSTQHPDPRMHLTLEDMAKPYADDPKKTIPLVPSSS